MNKYTLELTEEELNFIYDRCSNKAARLEEVNLKDTPCYRLAHQVMHKIYESKKEINFTPTADVKPIEPDTVPEPTESEPTKSTRDYWAEDVKHMQELSEWMNKQWNY
jgi:hypothetical protein